MSDALALVDEWGPERTICVSDVRTGMQDEIGDRGGAVGTPQVAA